MLARCTGGRERRLVDNNGMEAGLDTMYIVLLACLGWTAIVSLAWTLGRAAQVTDDTDDPAPRATSRLDGWHGLRERRRTPRRRASDAALTAWRTERNARRSPRAKA